MFLLLSLLFFKKWLIKDTQQGETQLKTDHKDTYNVSCIKGVVDCFFLGLIVFMGCSITSVNASFKKKKYNIFQIIYLYSTPLCPFSYK